VNLGPTFFDERRQASHERETRKPVVAEMKARQAAR
jgi:hypothetical protein